MDPITEAIAFGRTIVDKVWPNAENKEARAHDVATLLVTRDAARDEQQAKVNAVEAASTDRFVAGWRPFLGWVCGGTLAYVWIVRDLIAWLLLVFHVNVPPPPLVMQDAVMELTFGILGLSTLRTVEKLGALRLGK